MFVNIMDILHSWKVCITVAAVLLVSMVVSIVGYELDRRDDHRLAHSVSPDFTPEDGADTVNISVPSTLTSVLSPYFRFALSWRQRCWGEMKLHHPYVNVFTRYNRAYSRPLRALALLLNILTVFCIQAVIFTNNKICSHSSTQIDCESQWLTSWIKKTSVCYWDESSVGGDHCSTLQIGGSFQLSLKIALLSAVASIPLVFAFNWLVVHVLAADTKAVKVSIVHENREEEVSNSIVSSHRFFSDRKRRQELQETIATSTFGFSSKSESGLFKQEFEAYLKTKNAADAKDMRDAWKVSSTRNFTNKIQKQISKIRHLTVKEMQRFERDHMSSSRISDWILFLFIKDVTSGITRQIVDLKHRQERMKKREIHYMWQLIGYAFVLSLVVSMLVYLYLFGKLQDPDRQRVWFFSSLLWLGLDVVFFSTLAVFVQHISIPSFIFSDLNAITQNLFFDRGKNCGNEIVALSSSSKKKSSTSVVADKTIHHKTKPKECSFNAASFFFVSHRLAAQFPNTLANQIIMKYLTVWPRGSWHHDWEKTEKTRRCCCVVVFSSFLSIVLYLPPSIQESLFRFLSTVLIGVLAYIHIYLYNIFPALAACPLYLVALLYLMYTCCFRKKNNKVNARKSTIIIEVKPFLDLEEGGGEGKKVTFRVPSSTALRAKESGSDDKDQGQKLFDLNTRPCAVLSGMSANMDDYERYIVEDVLRDAVTKVVERGMDYVLNEKRNYTAIANGFAADSTKDRKTSKYSLDFIYNASGSLLVTEEEALMNLDSVMSMLEANNEESMEHFPRSFVGSVNSIANVSNVDNIKSVSFDLTDNAFENKQEEISRASSKSQTVDEDDHDGGDSFYPACQLEEDEQPMMTLKPHKSSEGSQTDSNQQIEQGQSCELVSIVIEERLEQQLSFQHAGSISTSNGMILDQEVQEKHQEMLHLGAEAMQNQLAVAHATAQRHREMDIDGLIKHQQQLRQMQVEAQQRQQQLLAMHRDQDYVSASATASAKRLEMELAQTVTEQQRLEREHAEAEKRYASEVWRVQGILAASSPGSPGNSLSRQPRIAWSRQKEDQDQEQEQEQEQEVVEIDLLGVSTMQDFMQSHKDSSSPSFRGHHKRYHDKELEQDQKQLEDSSTSQHNILAIPKEETIKEEPEANMTEEKLAAKQFVGTILDKYLLLSGIEVSHEEEQMVEEQVEIVKLNELSSISPTNDRKAHKTSFYFSPLQKAERKAKLLADAERILSMSQTKQKKKKTTMDTNTGEEDFCEDIDVDVVPVFTAWCDDVFDELNTNDPKTSVRKQNSALRKSSLHKSMEVALKLDDYFSDSGDDSPTRRGPLLKHSSPVFDKHKHKQDYVKAFSLLQNPKYVTNLEVLQRFLDDLGVSQAEDLAELDDEDLSCIFSFLKKISLKKFNRFMCRDQRS